MKIGYARVSTKRQKLAFQIDALERPGSDVVIAEKASGVAPGKRSLAAALALCDEGDTLVVWKLDRLGRDQRAVLSIINLVQTRNATQKIISGGAASVDIATASVQHSFGRERAAAGSAAVLRRKKPERGGNAAGLRKPR